MDGEMMKMRATPRLDVPAGKPLSLAPGGYHVMLMNLEAAAENRGSPLPLVLQVENKDKKVESVEITAEVRDLTARRTAADTANTATDVIPVGARKQTGSTARFRASPPSLPSLFLPPCPAAGLAPQEAGHRRQQQGRRQPVGDHQPEM